MPKRFLQTEYEKLTKKQLIKALYKIADRADDICAKLVETKTANNRLRNRLKIREKEFTEAS